MVTKVKKHPFVWGSLTSYYGLFLTIVGAYWIWITRGAGVPHWPGSAPLGSGYYLFWPAGLVLGAGVITLIGAWRAPKKITYILTDQVLRVERGRIAKQSTEVLRRNISEVEVSQTTLQKIFLHGTLKVRSLLDPEGELVMEKVFRPRKFRNQIIKTPR